MERLSRLDLWRRKRDYGLPKNYAKIMESRRRNMLAVHIISEALQQKDKNHQ